MPGFFRRVFSRRTLAGIVIGIAVLGVLLALLIVEENWRGRRAWEAYRAAAERRGVKLFVKDFIQPDIPDSENYAAVPIIRDCFAKQKDGESASNALRFPSAKVLAPPNDLKEQRFDPVECQRFFLETKSLTETSDNAAGDILRALEEYEPALQQLRDASARPHCKFPTHWENGSTVSLSHLSFIHSAARFFSLRTHAHLALGNSSAAHAEFSQAVRLHTALASEPTLIAGLVRIAILARLEGCAWDGLAAGQWAEAEVIALEKTFGGFRLFGDCRFAFTTERGFVNDALMRHAGESAKDLERSTRAFEIFEDEPREHSIGEWLFMRIFPRGRVFQTMVRANDYFDWLIPQFDPPNNGMTPEFIAPTQPDRVSVK